MRSKWSIVFWLAVVWLGSLSTARAWNGPGHMAVAGAAYDLLTPAEQQKLVAILLQHRDVSRLKTALNTQNPKPRDLVMAAATWPDLIKEDAAHFKNNGYDELGPITEIKDDGLMHKGWHFINTPYSRDATPLTKIPDDNTVDAVTVVRVLVKQLSGGESADKEAFDLAWLFHLTGDLHQPLHAIVGVDSVYPTGDSGGNSILITAPDSIETELHAYWDDILGGSAGSDRFTKRVLLDKDAATASRIVTGLSMVQLATTRDDLEPAHWADESKAIAIRDTYTFPMIKTVQIKDRLGNPQQAEMVTLDDNYHATALADCQQQVKLAAYRLAQILKKLLD